MNRRKALAFLGLAGLALAGRPALLLADSADELANQGQDALTDGNPAKALPILLEAQAKDPRNDRVEALLGRAYFQQGDARQALTHFTAAVRLNPEDTLSRIMIETISQFPQPTAGAKSRETPPRRSSPLAGEARAERQALLARNASPHRDGPFRLLIDPGHGGADSGAPGEGLREADVALDLSLRLARLLAAIPDGPTVSLTRTADVALPGWARAALAGYYGADLLLSLHATRLTTEPGVAGVALYTFARTPTDALAGAAAKAESMASGRHVADLGRGGQEYFARAVRQAAGTGHTVRAAALAAVLARSWPADAPLPLRVGAGPFRLLAEADAPAVLVEAGFLSNTGNAALLAVPEKRQALAKALADALLAVVREPAKIGS
uniref:N-acetylmuramoyl-L-alanine amidase n=1 Tax=Desulfovibrio sp. U5L TaxID=596152 RepID=I2Q164_9BACT